MKIKKLAYWNKQFDWRLETIEFSNLALLVGVSGVGKTQILRAIYNLKSIANGISFNGVSWDITFLTNNNIEYQWQGEFETQEVEFLNIPEDRKFKIINEKLLTNNKIIVKREGDEIIFKDQKTPKLPPFESLVYLFRQEEEIAPIRDSFNQIIFSAQCESIEQVYIIREPAILTEKLSDNVNLDSIKRNDLHLLVRLALFSQYFPKDFEGIKKSFIEIFDQVEDIYVGPVGKAKINSIVPVADIPVIVIAIKEKGVDKWIFQHSISSGMFKTLMHISELYLCPEGSVILIDEFENSLGVNCIDIITEDLLQENRDLQFIITSHHPYIINNIGMKYWKIVTRKGGVVTVKDAADINLGKSRHQAFIQLINSEVYTDGIAVK